MKKRKLRIINFLYLSDEKYNKIREYRNQQFIREVSLNSNIISEEEHEKYKKLLEKKKDYFAFLILNDEKDYSVITFKKINEDLYEIGEYLVKEEYKYEGGGIVNRYCTILLCNNLNIKYLNYLMKQDNTRGNRLGVIAKIQESKCQNGLVHEFIEVLKYDDEIVRREKGKKLFDKVYEIEKILI